MSPYQFWNWVAYQKLSRGVISGLGNASTKPPASTDGIGPLRATITGRAHERVTIAYGRAIALLRGMAKARTRCARGRAAGVA
eukprot:8875941-Pyramimonas_sp.AAC.1